MQDFQWYQWQKIIFFYATRVHPMKEHPRGRSPFTLRSFRYLGHHMVLILDGNSEIGAHVSAIWSVSVIWLDLEQAQIGYSFYTKRFNFFHACATYFELPSHIFTMCNPRQLNYKVAQFGFYVWPCIKRSNKKKVAIQLSYLVSQR